MKRNTMILMAGALLTVLSVAAVAQAYDQDPAATQDMEKTNTVMGTVVSISPASLVVKMAGGDQMIFIRDMSSRVPTTLSAGDAIRVDYETPEPGTFHATNVAIETAASNSAPVSQGATPNESTSMPKTASPLATVGLLGALALGGALAVRMIRG